MHNFLFLLCRITTKEEKKNITQKCDSMDIEDGFQKKIYSNDIKICELKLNCSMTINDDV